MLLISSSAFTNTPASSANSHVHGLRPTILSESRNEEKKVEMKNQDDQKNASSSVSSKNCYPGVVEVVVC
jgi:hypothetical protein